VSAQPIKAQDLTADDVRALYELILERMDISTKAERSRWERKVLRWNESVRRSQFRVTLRELIEH